MMKKILGESECWKLQEHLNRIVLKGCEKIKIGDMLHYNLEEQIGIRKAMVSIIRIIRNSVSNNYIFEICGNPNTIMFFSNSYRQRNEHLQAFQKVCSTLSDYIKIIPGYYHVRHLPKALWHIVGWMKQFTDLEIGFLQKLYFLSIVHQCFCEYELVNAYCRKKKITIKNAVSFCDVMPVDSFFVQKWNSLTINTITLQHGTFNLGHYGYTHTISNYFLAHSEFSKNNAIQCGVAEEKIHIVGAPQNIAVPESHFCWKRSHVIGVLLGGTVLESYDLELIQMVKVFAEKYNYRIYVKFHPGFGKNQYSVNVWDGIDQFYESGITIKDFADLVDFMVDDGSTVFVEYMVQDRMAFTYLCDINPYKGDKKIQLGFESYKEMEELFLMYQNQNEYLLQLLSENKCYLGTVNEPSYLYHKFFSEHLIPPEKLVDS